jgi:hypothetical protein
MHFRRSGISARPRTGNRARRYLAVLIALTFGASLIATGVALPASTPKPVVDAATTTIENAVAATGFAKSVHTTLASNMIGFDWSGRSRGTLEFRTLQAGKWSNWTSIDGDPSEGPDVGTKEYRHSKNVTSAGPVWIGEGVHDVQVRVQDGAMPHLRMQAIHSKTPAGSLPTINRAGADPAWPNVIMRDQWGANESWRTCAPDPPPPTVRYGIVHHTVSSNDYAPGDVPSIIQGIYYFHTHTNGWCDIGYNFLVDRFGRIYEGRYGGVTVPVVGAHAGGFNTGSTGVAMIGDYTSTPMPGATFNALRTIFDWKFWVHRVNAGAPVTVTAADFSGSKYPAGTVVTLPSIIGHRDVDQTDCPGDGAYPLIPSLRNDVTNDLTNFQPYPYGWYTQGSGPGVLVLSSRGGLYPSGGQPPVTQTGFWPGGDVARAAIRYGSGGLVADLFGGLHPFGGAAMPSSGGGYWPGQDVIRGMAKGATAASGYLLDDWGGLHAFGGAPPAIGGPYWRGQDVARAVVTRPNGISGYVLDANGGIHPFGGAPAETATGYWPGQDVARGIALRPDGNSGYTLDANGGVHPFGGAPAVNLTGYWPGLDYARGIIANGTTGGWVVNVDGGIFAFGGAPAIPTSMQWTTMYLTKAIL